MEGPRDLEPQKPEGPWIRDGMGGWIPDVDSNHD